MATPKSARTTKRAKPRGTAHYHFSRVKDTLVRDQHPGGHRRHQHVSRGLVGYGRTRESFTLL